MLPVRTAIPVAPESYGQGGPPPRQTRTAAGGHPATGRTPADPGAGNGALPAEMSAAV